MTILGVSAAVLVSTLLVFAEPASAGVRFSASIGGRIGSHRSHSYHRPSHGGYRHSGYRHSGHRYSSCYRPSYSYYRPSRSYSYYRPYTTTTYYSTTPYTSYSTYGGSAACGSCGGFSCSCGHSSTTYYTRPATTTTHYRTVPSGGCSSGTVVKYIIVR